MKKASMKPSGYDAALLAELAALRSRAPAFAEWSAAEICTHLVLRAGRILDDDDDDDDADPSDSIAAACNELKAMLQAKNKAYGNSALEPMRVFSKAEPTEQIRVRIDDKLSRIRNGTIDDEDTILDLIGYLILLRIARAGLK